MNTDLHRQLLRGRREFFLGRPPVHRHLLFHVDAPDLFIVIIIIIMCKKKVESRGGQRPPTRREEKTAGCTMRRPRTRSMILAVTPRQASMVADSGMSTSNIFVSIWPVTDRGERGQGRQQPVIHQDARRRVPPRQAPTASLNNKQNKIAPIPVATFRANEASGSGWSSFSSRVKPLMSAFGKTSPGRNPCLAASPPAEEMAADACVRTSAYSPHVTHDVLLQARAFEVGGLPVADDRVAHLRPALLDEAHGRELVPPLLPQRHQRLGGRLGHLYCGG